MYTQAVLLALVPSVFGAVKTVLVGANNQLTFTPAQVQAQAGDQVKFVFQTQNHTVTSGNPNVGCTPSGQFNSGFVPANNAQGGQQPSFTVNVANTQPITVYCAQAQHCQAGMVMVINPTQNGATSLAAYQALSAKAKKNTPAQGVNGGTLANTQQQAANGGNNGNAAAGQNGAQAAKGKGGKKAKKGSKRRSAKFAAGFVA